MMPSPFKIKVPAALATAMLVSACAGTSPTEADFGNSTRNFISHQQMQSTGTLGPNEPINSGDGRRLENVTTVYQTYVGDPLPVVRDLHVENGGQK